MVLASCLCLGFADIARRGEHELLANLGIRKRVVASFLLFPTLIGELIVSMARER